MEFREPVRQCGWQSHLRDTRIGSTGVVGRSGVCRRAGRTLRGERRRVGGILEKGGKDGFPVSVPHERLTYGVKGAAVTGVTGAPYIEGGCGLYGGSSS